MLDWKSVSGGRSALIIDGARRVGKSWIAEEFAKNEYESYLLIDFSKATKAVKRYFREYLNDLDTFFMYLLGEYNANSSRGKALSSSTRSSSSQKHGRQSSTLLPMGATTTSRRVRSYPSTRMFETY